jgi:hypothetical protein
LGTIAAPDIILESLSEIRDGFEQGLEPSLTEEGTSGTYILKKIGQENSASAVAVWKPIDEEPFAPNNPRGMKAQFGSNTCRPGVKSGESSLREVLAFLLDHDGFACVPPTALVELSHPSLQTIPLCVDAVTTDEFRNLISGLLTFKRQSKPSNLITKKRTSSPELLRSPSSTSSTNDSFENNSNTSQIPKLGSFQIFVPSEGPIENFSPNLFSPDEIHKIAVLDLRILNLDRNACNILVQQV